MNPIAKWAGGIAAALTVTGLVLWGVPYYIKSVVDDQVKIKMAELTTDPAAAPAVVTLTNDVTHLKAGQDRIEGKVDAFSTQFLQYLEREASR